jgi:hypothetical protein
MKTIVGKRISTMCRVMFFAKVAAAMVLAPILSSGEASGVETMDSTKIEASKYRQVVDRSIDYLRSRSADEQGAFSSKSGTGIASLCVAAVLSHRPSTVNDPAIKESLAFLEKNIRLDGGIYSEGSTHRNYETCLAIAAFVKANKTGRYNDVLKRAERFVREIQWDQGEGIETDDPSYGGAGYGSHNRPDLSNTAFMVDALHELGLGADDESIQKALIFVSRTQNLESPANDTVHAAKENDGGFYYTPAAGGESQAGKTPDGGLRSYGSMTYAGLKSMLYAGVEKSDPRVEAAMDFIEKNYTLEQNPGMGAAGLYYYYHTFAKSLNAAEVNMLIDAAGVEHNWRVELFNLLASKQAEDGSFINEENPRWMEGDRALVTGYALLALVYCDESKGAGPNGTN